MENKRAVRREPPCGPIALLQLDCADVAKTYGKKNLSLLLPHLRCFSSFRHSLFPLLFCEVFCIKRVVSPVSLCFLCPRPLFPTFPPQSCLLSPHTPPLTNEAGSSRPRNASRPCRLQSRGWLPWWLSCHLSQRLARRSSGPPPRTVRPVPSRLVKPPPSRVCLIPIHAGFGSVLSSRLFTLAGMCCVCVAQDGCPQLHVSSVTEDLNF